MDTTKVLATIFILIQVAVPLYALFHDTYDVDPWVSFSWGMYSTHVKCQTTFYDENNTEISVRDYFTHKTARKRVLRNTHSLERFSEYICKHHEQVYVNMDCVKRNNKYIWYEAIKEHEALCR